jgi:hypothetical protein
MRPLVVKAVTALKEDNGGPILVAGSATLVRALLAGGSWTNYG